MRDIRFRAWHKDRKVMCDVIDISFRYKKVTLILEAEGAKYHWYVTEHDFDDVELMLYTGPKDKNDVEIFEGDIVKRTYLFDGAYDRTHIGEVVYDKERARYIISKPNKYIEPKTEDLGNLLSDETTYEVIGNIWENPELLEG